MMVTKTTIMIILMLCYLSSEKWESIIANGFRWSPYLVVSDSEVITCDNGGDDDGNTVDDYTSHCTDINIIITLITAIITENASHNIIVDHPNIVIIRKKLFKYFQI